MNKRTLIFTIALMVILTACGSAPSTQTSRQFNSAQSGNFSTELPLASKLVMGTFKLTGANLTITPKEANDLLPLWQVYHELSTSDTAAPEEIDALVAQIQETMTPGQIQAINGMNLTQRDVFTFMREQGISFGNGTGTRTGQGNSTNGTQNQGNNRRFQGGGNFPPGGFGGGGGPAGGFGGGGGGQGFSPQQIATAQARRAANGGNFRSTRAPAPLVEALIKMLQQKAGS